MNADEVMEIENLNTRVFSPGLEYSYDPSKVEKYQEVLRRELKRKGRASIANIANEIGLRRVCLELKQTKPGLEFLMPVDEQGKGFFNQKEIIFFDDKEGIKIKNGIYIVKPESDWENGFDEWISIKRTSDHIGPTGSFFRPYQLDEMRSFNRGFRLIDADWGISLKPDETPYITKAAKVIDFEGEEKASLNYTIYAAGMKKIKRLELGFNWLEYGPLCGTDDINTYDICQNVTLEEGESGYRAEGSAWIYCSTNDTNIRLNILGDGSFSESRGTIGRLGVLYRILGDPTQKVDFCETIANVLRIAESENYHRIMRGGFFQRK